MIGLDSVKADIDSLIDEALTRRKRVMAGYRVAPKSNHLIFSGNPGTGKTSAARDVAKIYHALGIVPTDKFVEADRKDFIGGYVGQSTEKTAAIFDKAKGGVLFIDEAYSLAREQYGQEAIDTLVPLIENSKADTVVILAGYPEKMNEFLDVNPGLRSRFPKTIAFPNYAPHDLEDIFHNFMDKSDYKFADNKARSALRKTFNAIASNPESGNARDVSNLFDAIVSAHARRVARLDDPAQLDKITVEDVRNAGAL